MKRVPTKHLFAVDTKPRRTLAGNLPELLGTTTCPDCGAATTDLTYTEAALFRHAGYGAHRTTTLRHCARFCGWGIERAITETNPRR